MRRPTLTTLEDLALRLRRSVERLAGGPRQPGTAAHRAAADWIGERFREAGLTVADEAGDEGGQAVRNVLAGFRPAGGAGARIVIGAHYDSAPGTPGADDNASAVAALLELADHLGRRGPGRRPVELVAYDLEEYGFVGSRRHARDLRAAGTSVELMISLEMLGFTAPSQGLPPFLAGRREVGDFIGLVANEAAAGPFAVVEAACRRDPDLPVESLVLPGTGTDFPEARLSDHASFWDEGFPAMMVTDTSFLRNPHYHMPSDRPETLDYPFLARVTTAMCRALDDLVSAPPGPQPTR